MRAKKKKNTRSDSTEEKTRIMAAAFKDISPPDHVPLEKKDIPFFNSVIEEYARAEWTDHTLELAAMLAGAMADMVEERSKLRKEGSILKTNHGTPVVNPRKSVIQMYSGTILSLRRSLSLHARAQGVNPADMGKRRIAGKAAEKVVKEIGSDLINYPGKTH